MHVTFLISHTQENFPIQFLGSGSACNGFFFSEDDHIWKLEGKTEDALAYSPGPTYQRLEASQGHAPRVSAGRTPAPRGRRILACIRTRSGGPHPTHTWSGCPPPSLLLPISPLPAPNRHYRRSPSSSPCHRPTASVPEPLHQSAFMDLL